MYNKILPEGDCVSQSPATAIIREFPTWKVIHTGKYENVAAIQEALEKNGCKISDWARDIICKPAFRLTTKKEYVELVAVSSYELGFTEPANLFKIFQRATTSFNLDLCEPEDALYLREKYLDQPGGELRIIAMEPITDSDDVPWVLDVEHGDGFWLSARCDDPDEDSWIGVFLVFRRRKSA